MILFTLEVTGFEPVALCLQNIHSTIELHSPSLFISGKPCTLLILRNVIIQVITFYCVIFFKKAKKFHRI